MNLRRIPLLFACICLLMLTGCGFHPRAALAIPSDLGPVKVISADPYSPLGDSLSRALTHAGAQAAKAADTKAAALRIVSENFTTVPLSVDAFSEVREYIITYTVKFSFVAADNTDISALQEAKLQRDYIYDDAHALGAADEQITIQQELRRDMAATIIRRISIALRHYTPTPTQ